jgi:ubiquinone/menaquinone biosynthesis C-methylase UbiE
MDLVLRQPSFQRERRVALAPVYGTVLEVGFGTGLNLPHYPATVTSLTVLDPTLALPARVTRRLAAAPMPVTCIQGRAEMLGCADASFDCVVTTWTLCSIPDVGRALQHIRRVLKPGGLYAFLEHGRSADPRRAWWQDVYNPLHRCVAGGCNVNRPIDTLITQNGLEIVQLDCFCMPHMPRVLRRMYRGLARPAGL